VLAALRAAGCRPHLFVYGGPDSTDVRIARDIATAEGLEIEWVDKEAWRAPRHKGGALSVSGGCGEIFRNFFFLPDRRFSAAAVARTFYARYAKTDVTDGFDERVFL